MDRTVSEKEYDDHMTLQQESNNSIELIVTPYSPLLLSCSTAIDGALLLGLHFGFILPWMLSKSSHSFLWTTMFVYVIICSILEGKP